MSSHDAEDVDIDVVSSPEPSPRRRISTSDDDVSQNYSHRRHSPAIPSITTNSATASPPNSFHSAHVINSQFHSHLSNSLLNSANNNKENHITVTESSRLSPPRTPETNNNSLSHKLSPSTTTNPGYTSFSISSILSRQDSPNAKKLAAPIPSFAINGPQDAMISRWDEKFDIHARKSPQQFTIFPAWKPKKSEKPSQMSSRHR